MATPNESVPPKKPIPQGIQKPAAGAKPPAGKPQSVPGKPAASGKPVSSAGKPASKPASVPGKAGNGKPAAKPAASKKSVGKSSPGGRRRIGQVFIDLGFIDEDQLWEVLEEAKNTAVLGWQQPLLRPRHRIGIAGVARGRLLRAPEIGEAAIGTRRTAHGVGRDSVMKHDRAAVLVMAGHDPARGIKHSMLP